MSVARRLTSDDTCAAVATRWSRCLGLPVRLTVLPAAVVLPAPHRSRLPVAVARLVGATPVALEAQTLLFAGQVQTLAGLASRPSGPVPLSDAEVGFFAYLALEALAALPDLDLCLAGVDDAPDALAHRIVAWTAQIGEQRGLISWTTPGRQPNGRAHGVPITLRMTRTAFAPAGGLLPGAALLLDATPWALGAGDRPVHFVSLVRAQVAEAGPWRFHVADGPAIVRPPMEFAVPLDPASLPCALTLDLGTIVLPAGVVADLAPGARVPLELASPPRIWLRAGDTVVAEGELIDLGGAPAIRITRSLLAP
jgi:hypothetical protein